MDKILELAGSWLCQEQASRCESYTSKNTGRSTPVFLLLLLQVGQTLSAQHIPWGFMHCKFYASTFLVGQYLRSPKVSKHYRFVKRNQWFSTDFQRMIDGMTMELGPEERITLETYDLNAGHWTAARYHERLWTEDIARLREALPGGRVIDIGAGSGTDTAALIESGYEYVGVDASAAMIAEARQLHPNAEFQQMSIYDLDFPDESFDGFWAAAILLHVPRHRVGMALDQIHRVVRPEGMGFISLKQGSGEAVTEERADDGTVYTRLFTFYQADEFRDILAEHGFDTVSIASHRQKPGLTWLKFIVQSRSPGTHQIPQA